MTTHPLDNPLWASLTTLHEGVAVCADGVLAYPPDVAPFLAIPCGERLSRAALAALVPEGGTAFLLGPEPEVPSAWELRNVGPILQMVCEQPLSVPCDVSSTVEQLALRDQPAVVALAGLVYPHYFRLRTVELGRYFGVRGEKRLDAMIGERMGTPGFREISAVCTHPEGVGRGLARRLLVHLSNDLLARGVVPFLHVDHANERARRLYERNNYRTRIEIPFWSVRSLGPTR